MTYVNNMVFISQSAVTIKLGSTGTKNQPLLHLLQHCDLGGGMA